jgi:hypothetical protein
LIPPGNGISASLSVGIIQILGVVAGSKTCDIGVFMSRMTSQVPPFFDEFWGSGLPNCADAVKQSNEENTRLIADFIGCNLRHKLQTANLPLPSIDFHF